MTNVEVGVQYSSFTVPRNVSSGISLSNINNLTIESSQFINLIGTIQESTLSGGAIYLTETLENKVSSNSIKISRSIFQNCSNSNGGAIGIADVANLVIGNETRFINNTATTGGNGGAIQFSCNNH